MSQKSYDGSATVYLIPTPIGNLEDITLRAINILKEVSVIFSEDTRVTGLLLKHLNIKTKLISSHEHNEYKNKEKLLSYLKQGLDVGIVTDRGTPIISDPGYELVKCAIENNYNVVGLPGPTALIPALIVSGINPCPFLFYGFLSNKDSKRRKELEELKNYKETIIFYESPHRVEKLLNDMGNIMGNRQICISREISKKYEEIYRGKIEEVKEQMIEVRGELVIILEGQKEENLSAEMSVLQEVNELIKTGINSKEAIKEVAHNRKIPKSEVYRQYHRGD